MAGDGVFVKIEGLDDVVRAFRDIPVKLRRGLVRNALAAGARVFRDEAKRLTPVLRVPVKYRKPGTVRDAIRVRTSKAATREGNIGVFVNVVPAKGAKFKTVKKSQLFGKVKTRTRVKVRDSQRGAKSPNDPFYWRFLEFATRRTKGSPAAMLQTSARTKGAEALQRIVATLRTAFEKLNQKETP